MNCDSAALPGLPLPALVQSMDVPLLLVPSIVPRLKGLSVLGPANKQQGAKEVCRT
jgi:hypothetical protein